LATPVLRAAERPPLARHTYRTRGSVIPATTALVSSLDPSSTTTTSKFGKVWSSTL
jgi:hypothetical protein